MLHALLWKRNFICSLRLHYVIETPKAHARAHTHASMHLLKEWERMMHGEGKERERESQRRRLRVDVFVYIFIYPHLINNLALASLCPHVPLYLSLKRIDGNIPFSKHASHVLREHRCVTCVPSLLTTWLFVSRISNIRMVKFTKFITFHSIF